MANGACVFVQPNALYLPDGVTKALSDESRVSITKIAVYVDDRLVYHVAEPTATTAASQAEENSVDSVKPV